MIFGELEIGDIFKSHPLILMKIEDCYDTEFDITNCILLIDFEDIKAGTLYFFENIDEIEDIRIMDINWRHNKK